ncbi:MAG: 3-oxoacyl-ACP reductase FabG [Deinococcus sp.]|nr:3-oxoacyl-ACP reductase FabG [Deinococcus sp.]
MKKKAALPAMQVTGQVAIVTGSGRGLGKAIALALAEAGAHVVVTDLPGQLEDAQATADAVQEIGRQALAVPLDVTSLQSIQRMVQKARQRFSQIDILVNNAGINIRKMALEVTEPDWDQVLDVNLKGVFFCSQAVAREMVQRQAGKIINIASQYGVIGDEQRAAYCASKAGVVNLTRVLAIEWAPYHINVNAVGPTYVLTPLTEKLFADRKYRRETLRRIPLGRLGKPEDVAGAVVFLASPAADMITGHTLLVDGGWTAW